MDIYLAGQYYGNMARFVLEQWEGSMDIYLAGNWFDKDKLKFMHDASKQKGSIITESREGDSMDLYLAGLQGMSGYGRYVLPEHTDQFEDMTQKKGCQSMDLYMAGGINGNCKPIWTDTAERLENGCAEPTGIEVIDEYISERNKPCGRLSLAGSQGHHKHDDVMGINNKSGKIDIAILESFYYADKWTEALIPRLNKFLLDSGAFTFRNEKHGNVDWNDYLERYIDFINRNDVKLFFELDIDSIIGYENVLKLRKRLEQGTGKKCIPVWHVWRGKEDFLKMCDEYQYVSLGGIVNADIKRADYEKMFPWFINEAHKRGAKIHGLGFTKLSMLEKYHFDSVDSTSWTSGNRFGHVYRFNGRTMEKFGRESNQKMKDSRRLAINNFNEWVKFQKYAEMHL